MALLDLESFDIHQTDLLGSRFTFVTAGVSIDPTHGQCGSSSLKTIQTPSQGFVTVGLASTGLHAIGGVSLYTSSFPVSLGLYLWGGLEIHKMEVQSDGSIVGYYNPDAAFPPISFVSPGGLISLNRITFIEWDLLLGASGTGSVGISIDGQSRYTQTGISTVYPGEANPPTGFQLGGLSAGTKTVYFDSLYLADGSGAAPWNARVGHGQVQALVSTGAGATTNFSVTGVAANWNVSDNSNPAPTTKYVASSTAGNIDSYVYSDVPLIASTQILGVMISLLAKEDAAGSRTIDGVVRQSGTDYVSGVPKGVPTTDFGYLRFLMQTNPATSAQWVLNDVNADQYGVKVVT